VNPHFEKPKAAAGVAPVAAATVAEPRAAPVPVPVAVPLQVPLQVPKGRKKPDEVLKKFCAVVKLLGRMKDLSDYVKDVPRSFMEQFLAVVAGNQLLEQDRLDKAQRADKPRQVSEKQLEFARYYADILNSMLSNRGRVDPFKLLTDNGVFSKPLAVEATVYKTEEAITEVIQTVTHGIAVALEGVEGAESLAFVSHLVLGSKFGQLFEVFRGLRGSDYFVERGWTDWATFLSVHCPKTNVRTVFNHRKFFGMYLQYPNLALVTVTTYSEFMRNHVLFIASLKGDQGAHDAFLWRADRQGKMRFVQALSYQLGNLQTVARFVFQGEDETEVDFLRKRGRVFAAFDQEEKETKEETIRHQCEEDDNTIALGALTVEDEEEQSSDESSGEAPKAMDVQDDVVDIVT